MNPVILGDPRDFDRSKFLEALLAASRHPDGLFLSDWENEFLASYCQTHQYHRWFTPGRRVATDRLWMKYGSAVGMEHSTFNIERPTSKEADPAGCQYLVMDDARLQHPCNEPAALQRLNGFRYCQTHADQVQRDLKRQGKILKLVPFGS